MIEFLKSFLFGIVEGITEWLPISSTGHLILLNQFVKLDVSEEFYSMFEVVIQLGAILAVVILFWNQIFPFGAPEGIVGALILGVSRTVAAEFTFVLAIPVMFGASLLKLVKFGLNFTGTEAIILLIGMVTAFVSSIIVIQFLMGYIKKHDFKVFGYYRIVLGILVILYALFLA